MSTQTFNLSMSQSIVRDLDEYSKEEGQTRSDSLRQMVQAKLSVWKKGKARRDQLEAIEEFGRLTEELTASQVSDEEVVEFIRELRGKK